MPLSSTEAGLIASPEAWNKGMWLSQFQSEVDTESKKRSIDKG